MEKKILIAYLNAEATNHLEFENNANSDINRQIALLQHPEVVFYRPTEFALAFNTEYVSDYGSVAIVDSKTRELIY